MTKFVAWDNSYFVVVSKDYQHAHQVQKDDVLYGIERYCPRMSAEEAWERFSSHVKAGKHFDVYHYTEEYEEFVLFAFLNSTTEEEILAYSKMNNINDACWGYDYKEGLELNAQEVASNWEMAASDEDWYLVSPHTVKLLKLTESDGNETKIRYINEYTGCCVRSEVWKREQ